jgi:predicted RNA-binding Zn ribbon-like protein
MIKLDDNLLQELGLAAMPPEEKKQFLRHIYETLEMRVGTRLAENMSEQQLNEFEDFINKNDEQGAFHWLESNFPNYKDVVAEEFETLKTEIKPVAQDILAASTAQSGDSQPPQSPEK